MACPCRHAIFVCGLHPKDRVFKIRFKIDSLFAYASEQIIPLPFYTSMRKQVPRSGTSIRSPLQAAKRCSCGYCVIRAPTGSAKRDIHAKPTASREAVQLWVLRNTRAYWFREAELAIIEYQQKIALMFFLFISRIGQNAACCINVVGGMAEESLLSSAIPPTTLNLRGFCPIRGFIFVFV